MNIEILNQSKDDIELSIDDSTVAEIMRVYLNNLGVDFVAWKREHPSKPCIMKIRSSGKSVKKLVEEAVDSIKKDCSKIVSELKK